MTIDKNKAKEIAIRFFEQHHHQLTHQNAVFKVGIWEVTPSVASIDKKIRKVRIDANYGTILGYV